MKIKPTYLFSFRILPNARRSPDGLSEIVGPSLVYLLTVNRGRILVNKNCGLYIMALLVPQCDYE